MATENDTFSLHNIFIFCPKFCEKEGEEYKKVLFYYPPATDINVQIRYTGVTEAIIKFVKSFDVNAKCKWIRTAKFYQFYFQSEEDYWIAMAVNSTDSSNHLVSGNLYFSQLQRLYKTFTLFMGSFSLLLEHLNNDMIAFKQKLFEFFTWYIHDMKLTECNVASVFQGIQYLPLDKRIYLHVQSFINQFHCAFQMENSFCALIVKQYLVWNNLSSEDMRVVYNFLVNSTVGNYLLYLDDKTIDLDESVDSARLLGNTKTGRFLAKSSQYYEKRINNAETVPSIFFKEDFTSVYLNGSLCRLIIYNAFSSTFLIFIHEKDSSSSDMLSRLEEFMQSKMKALALELYTSTKKRFNKKYENTEKFVYFNKLNFAQKNNMNDENKPLSSFPRILNILIDLCSQKEKNNRTLETVIKTCNDQWMIKHVFNSREVYAISQHKNATLMEIDDDMHAIYEKQIRSVFFNVMK